MEQLGRIQDPNIKGSMELISSGALMEALFIHSADAIGVVNLEGQVVLVNHAFEQLYGWRREEIVGKQLPFATPAQILKYKATLLEGHSVSMEETLRVRKDGVPIHVTTILTPVRNPLGQVTAIAGISRDITDRKRLEEHLQLAHQELADTVRYQKGMTFKYIARDGRFIHTLCDGDLLYRMGLTPERVVGKELKDIFHSDIADELTSYYRRAWQGEENVIYEGKDGDITYLAFFKPIVRQGEVVEVIVSCMDVTRLQQVEQALAETESMYKKLVGSALVGVYLVQNGKIVYANRCLAETFGYKQEEFIRLDPMKTVVEGSWPEELEQRSEASGDPGPIQYHIRGIRKDGAAIDLEGRAVATRYDGKPALIGTLLDVTPAKKVEQLLRDSDQRYRRLLKFLPEPILVHAEGTLLYLNKAAVAALGAASHEELISKSVFDFVPPEFHDFIRERIGQVLESDDPLQFVEIKLVKLDRTAIDAEISSIRIHNYNGKYAVLVVFRDITERKRADELLRRSEKLALVGQLAAGVAHEIRNPLTSLKGFSQLLKEKYKDNNEFFDIMISELDRINFIVNEFMLLAKPQNVSFKRRNLNDVILGVVSLLETQAILSNVRIVTLFKHEHAFVECDENQLKQVFVNFLKNAIEAMPDGGEIRIDVHRLGADRIRILIADQGCGIPQELIPKLGEPFFTTKETGTGLGLMVSYRIIEAHKGHVHIESEAGKGTTIHVHLPEAGRG